MNVIGVEQVSLVESFVLGWKKADNSVTIFLEVLLTKLHPQFEPFSKKEAGCYKRGRLECRDVTRTEGLNEIEVQPKWNEQLGEYDDLAEILDVLFAEDFLRLQGDTRSIIVFCAEVELFIDDSASTGVDAEGRSPRQLE